MRIQGLLLAALLAGRLSAAPVAAGRSPKLARLLTRVSPSQTASFGRFLDTPSGGGIASSLPFWGRIRARVRADADRGATALAPLYGSVNSGDLWNLAIVLEDAERWPEKDRKKLPEILSRAREDAERAVNEALPELLARPPATLADWLRLKADLGPLSLYSDRAAAAYEGASRRIEALENEQSALRIFDGAGLPSAPHRDDPRLAELDARRLQAAGELVVHHRAFSREESEPELRAGLRDSLAYLHARLTRAPGDRATLALLKDKRLRGALRELSVQRVPLAEPVLAEAEKLLPESSLSKAAEAAGAALASVETVLVPFKAPGRLHKKVQDAFGALSESRVPVPFILTGWAALAPVWLALAPFRVIDELGAGARHLRGRLRIVRNSQLARQIKEREDSERKARKEQRLLADASEVDAQGLLNDLKGAAEDYEAHAEALRELEEDLK